MYVFPKSIQDKQGVPLLAGIQRGMTHHLEKFTTNFTGVFNGGVIDVLFIAPATRPYFAVYCLGGDCLDLSHELRSELGLPVVHHGWDTNRERVYDIRYNPNYVRKTTKEDADILVPVNGEDAIIHIESGRVEGDYFEFAPEPHEIVVRVSDEGKTVEVARLRAPSARISTEDDDGAVAGEDDSPERGGPDSSPISSPQSISGDRTLDLSPRALSRLADIVKLQPTSNGELADAWGLSTGSEVYQYLSSELDDFYYRDDNSRIQATNRAEQAITDTE